MGYGDIHVLSRHEAIRRHLLQAMPCGASNVLKPLHLVRLPSATTPQQTGSVDVVAKKWSSDAAESERWEKSRSSADQQC